MDSACRDRLIQDKLPREAAYRLNVEDGAELRVQRPVVGEEPAKGEGEERRVETPVGEPAA